MPRSCSGRFDTGPSHTGRVTVASETKRTMKRTKKRLTLGNDGDNNEDAEPSSTQLVVPRRADVHYAVVQCLSHPRPVVLQLRAILHITAENKSLRNRARPRHDGARGCCSLHAWWHKIIASFIPGNDLIAWTVISGHRSPRRRGIDVAFRGENLFLPSLRSL